MVNGRIGERLGRLAFLISCVVYVDNFTAALVTDEP